MNIKTRLLRSYLFFIILIVFSAATVAYTSRLINRHNDYLIRLYEFEEKCQKFFSFLQFKGLHWAYGKTIDEFKGDVTEIQQMLDRLTSDINAGRFFYPSTVRNELTVLNEVWTKMQMHFLSIIQKVDKPEFYPVLENLSFSSDLQRLNSFWIESYFKNPGVDEEGELVIRRFLSDVDNIINLHSKAIYGHTNLLISKINNFKSRVEQNYLLIFIIYSFLLISGFVFVAVRFSSSISKPIMKSAHLLEQFIGKAIGKQKDQHDDELIALDNSVKNLISYYTNVSSAIHKLSCGEIEHKITLASTEDVIGTSLRELVRYLQDLVSLSTSISYGRYDISVPPKSKNDILAHNFNRMANVIAEKIKTLKNVFDTVGEGIVVINENLEVVEANEQFLNLVKLGSIGECNANYGIIRIFIDEGKFLIDAFNNIDEKALSTHILDDEMSSVPVTITAKEMLPGADKIRRLMLIFTNESLEKRYQREYDLLKSQTTLAELKALRAQINPHFLFNTLNTILHYSETQMSYKKVPSLVEKLSDIFRYTFNATKKGLVTLEEEFEHIKNYIEIEQFRFGERLLFTMDIDDGVGEQRIPSMLLQPIIENAIKYGEDDAGNKLVKLICREENHEIILEVLDTGKNKTVLSGLLNGSGTGLKNVNARLMTLFQRELVFSHNSPSGLKVRISIPVE